MVYSMQLDIHQIQIYKDKQLLHNTIPIDSSVFKLTNLLIDTEYQIKLSIKTTSGYFISNILQVKTHNLDNLTGINVCFGSMKNALLLDQLTNLVFHMGASISSSVNSDTTHFICEIAKGEFYKQANHLNIPVVTPEFLYSCETNKKIQSAHLFYLSDSSKMNSIDI